MVKILIVDDEQNIRAVLREYAEFEGYQCDEAEDGMEAVKLARENTYDVIIMDVMIYWIKKIHIGWIYIDSPQLDYSQIFKHP